MCLGEIFGKFTAMERIQSPSSINLYRRCPRKYYYKYVRGLATPPNIYQIKGKVLHSILEKFFDLDVNGLDFNNYEGQLKSKLQELAVKIWKENKELIDSFGLSQKDISFYFDQIVLMLVHWFELFNYRLSIRKKESFDQTFNLLKPVREKRYYSDYYKVQGYIDAIENFDGNIRIMDYKTTTSEGMNEEYKTQLAIYTLLYYEEHGKLPDKVGIYFLKDDGIKEEFLDVGVDLLEHAKNEIMEIKERTVSEKMEDYPKTQEVYKNCKWSSGRCEFYEACYGQKTFTDFQTADKIIMEEDLGEF